VLRNDVACLPARRATGVRPSTRSDTPAIRRLLREVGLEPNVDDDHLEWKYWSERSDWAGSRSFVLERGGEILAHAGVVPGACRAARRVTIAHLIDWAARPDAAGAGVSLMKSIGRMADALLAVGGSEQTLRILPHIGFRSCGTAAEYVRPLHPLRILQTEGGLRWKRLPRLARSAIWSLSALRGVPPGWRVQRVTPGETGVLDAVVRADAEVSAEGAGGKSLGSSRLGRALVDGMRLDGTLLERSAQQLEYALRCPIASMALYGVKCGGDIRGYFLLAHVPGQVRLADYRILSNDPADWRSLILCAVREATQSVAAVELVTWAGTGTLERVLGTCGFHPRGRLPVQALARRGSDAFPASILVHMLDNDAAYYHAGRPALWV